MSGDAVASLGGLRKRAEFLAAARARKAVTGSLILQERDRRDDSPAIRVGFTASKKVGNAVTRNRAKRRMRAVAHEDLIQIGRPGCDYVLIARKDATTEYSYSALRTDLHKAVERLRGGARA